MSQLPIFINVQDRAVLVVGGGFHGARRTRMLTDSGAVVSVVAPKLCPTFEEIPGYTHISRDFEVSDLAGVMLVYVATDNHDEDTRVARLAQENGILVNAMDRPDVSTFTVPGIVDRSPLTIAIASDGQAPILSRILRAKIETLIPAGFGRLASFVSSRRDQVMKAVPDMTGRRRFWERISEGPVAELILSGREPEAQTLFEGMLETQNETPIGEVYLVGSGPGDPDLLTFKALRLMQQADIVLHDRLVSDEILALVRREAEHVFVGKKRSDHTLPQDQISQALVDLARQGKRVLRLKGGDPFTFGRGGEEMELLAEQGIPFHVVPGVTAATGCAAYAGIPLTHRDHAQACVFVTGHTKDGNLDLSWEALTQPRQTVVVYMGLHTMAQVTAEFIAHGMSPDIPAAIVDKGTRPDQQVVVGNLSNIAQLGVDAELTGPAVLIIGTVVTLREKLVGDR